MEEAVGVARAIAIVAVVVVGLGWLAVSFLSPGRRREVLEWCAATGLYVALASFFLSLALRGWQAGREPAWLGFGFLTLLFTAGAVVSLLRTIGVARGRSGEGALPAA